MRILIDIFVVLYTRYNLIMGKQSRRIRNHTAPVKQPPPTPVKQSRTNLTLKLDHNNAEDARVIDMIKSREKYIPLIREDIRSPRNGDRVSIKDALKYKLREIRQQQAIYLHEISTEVVNAYALTKNGVIEAKCLDIYFDNFNGKTSLIKFLTYLHNGNGDKASHYYLKWREMMSRRIDQLLFDDCSDEYVEIDGKRIDAGKDEAVRLMGETIQTDVDFYTMAYPVLIGTAIPKC